MMGILKKSSRLLALTGVVLALLAGGAFADKPEWAGDGKHKEKKEKKEKKERDDHGRHQQTTFSFGSDDQRIVKEYYGTQLRKGKCPPGLAKKNDGCQSPGQAKKWQKGQTLAKDIKYYEIPLELRGRLPEPPPNHRYVQVANDILMIAIGSSMVVDAIEDILH